MNAGHRSNNGDKPNGFALVRKPSSAIEKAAPGARRIVSGMVADTLALTKLRGKLLIVDDQYEVRDWLRVIFEDEYNLLLAENGATAIELAKQHDIDVVVTNINTLAAPMGNVEFRREGGCYKDRSGAMGAAGPGVR